MKHPKLRDSKHLITNELYPIGDIPKEYIVKIGGHVVYLIHSGRADMTGDDWGDIFADAIGGKHLASPVGIADVELGNMAWSMKTVKSTNVFECESIRLISGRCSPDYSFGITDPHENIQRTGDAVLAVWNERINIARDHYNQVRESILIRNEELSEFRLFEEDLQRYRTSDYEWVENSRGNLEGIDIHTGAKRFTWQPHGSQFTIHTPVPADAVKFTVRRPPVISIEDTLKTLNFDDTWVKII